MRKLLHTFAARPEGRAARTITQPAAIELPLVMLVREPASQVAAIARMFVGIADEIVIAVTVGTAACTRARMREVGLQSPR